jgi:hypothetical protein
MYGHVEILAKAVAEGARSVAGVEASIKRVPEIMPEDVARAANVKLDQAAPVATVDELPNYGCSPNSRHKSGPLRTLAYKARASALSRCAYRSAY